MTGPEGGRSGSDEALYVAARTALLDVLDVLGDQLPAIVVVGAQAVYLRAGEAPVGVAPYTTDADLALDPRSLREAPTIPELLHAAGIEADRRPGRDQPGMWVTETLVAGDPTPVSIELLVPAGFASPEGTRGARLGPHGERTARKAGGLEGCLVDADPMVIGSLDPADDRVRRVRVAGPAGLVIAKTHKLVDRLEGGREDRVSDKDAGDVYRLLLGTRTADLVERYQAVLSSDPGGTVARASLGHLRDLFGFPRAPGIAMAGRSFGGAVPEARIVAVCASVVERLTGELS